MAKDLKISGGSKAEKYSIIYPQIESLVTAEGDLIANLANISAALKEQFKWLWVGFYLVKDEELVLGPFQGPVACTRIKKGMGVCGIAWESAETIIVDNVNEFHGHIACSTLSKSEIVVPIIQNDIVLGVLDVDSTELNSFDETDKMWLQKIVRLANI